MLIIDKRVRFLTKADIVCSEVWLFVEILKGISFKGISFITQQSLSQMETDEKESKLNGNILLLANIQ